MLIMLQWSRRLSTAETTRGRVRSLRYYRASMEPPSFDGGNFEEISPFHIVAIEHASMEPPSFDGGNRLRLRHVQSYPLALQWSRRLSTAETADAPASIRLSWLSLQWSRRLSTAETPQRLFRGPGEEGASMEPPSFDGGNLEAEREEARQRSLQWSRRLSTAETSGIF